MRKTFHYSLLVFLGCMALTFLLSEAYLDRAGDIEKTLARPIILFVGALFSIASGFLTWSLETRDQYLKREVDKRTVELEQKNRELNTKNSEIESFIHIVSHDLKSPLVSILGFANVLKTDLGAALSGTNLEYFNRIVANAKQMTELLQDLLELSRVGRIEDQKENVQLKPLIQEILLELKPQIEQKKIEIQVSSDLPELWGARNRIRQVFVNLIGNAVKYIGQSEKPRIVIAAQQKSADAFEISVRDNGIGIPKESQRKVFQIFQRFHQKSGIEGTGIGLSIVKKIVETNGGRAWFDSEPGKGSTFFVDWPAVR